MRPWDRILESPLDRRRIACPTWTLTHTGGKLLDLPLVWCARIRSYGQTDDWPTGRALTYEVKLNATFLLQAYCSLAAYDLHGANMLIADLADLLLTGFTDMLVVAISQPQ